MWLVTLLTPRLSSLPPPPVCSAGSPSPALGLKVGPLQGSGPGPLFFSTSSLYLGELMHFHGFKYHLHDNDFQIYTPH